MPAVSGVYVERAGLERPVERFALGPERVRGGSGFGQGPFFCAYGANVAFSARERLKSEPASDLRARARVRVYVRLRACVLIPA